MILALVLFPDCHSLTAVHMNGVNIKNLNTSISLFLFSDVYFSKSGTVREIEFNGARAGSVYVSFWRKVEKYNNTVIMVGKILVQSTEVGVQVIITLHC